MKISRPHTGSPAHETHSHEEIKQGYLPIGLFVIDLAGSPLSPMHPESEKFEIEVRCFVCKVVWI